MGKWGALLIGAGAVVSITGTLNAIMLVGSRLPFAFSVQGQFPSFFQKVHAKYATPTWSLWVFAGVTLFVSLNQNFIAAAKLSAITRVMIYGIICIALLRLRQKDTGHETYLKLRYGKWLAWLALPIVGWLLTGCEPEEAVSIAIALAVGAVIYGLVVWKRARK
jgi:amino acid transporter